MNIQYVIHEGEVYVIEVNPRSSRTVPYISKVTGVPMVDLATRIMLGHTLKEMGWPAGWCPPPGTGRSRYRSSPLRSWPTWIPSWGRR